jgi:hypothetical protein
VRLKLMCYLFYVQVTVHRDKLRTNQPTRYINIQHLFCNKTLHASGILFAHHHELSTVRTAIGTFHAGYMTTSKHRQVEFFFSEVSRPALRAK